ncbi:auxin-responsive protein SAUR68-like [Diospyros lotus]|uniref:auxin-responsive protein SAUR68-like n=1 Tax=Diospyros lotus TaxID=55363 RepID=UPI002251C79F|nr:auxin-responsive protein SAUR68-like [Diospyros lotus]
MINTKKLIKMARKWQRVAAIRRRIISIPRAKGDVSSGCSSPSVADRGHFVVYTADQRRFAFPIAYLNHEIIRGLLELSEEEFGLPSDGPITLPCDAAFMEYVVSLIPRRTSKEMKEALLVSIANNGRCSMSHSLLHHQQKPSQQSLLCSF